MRLYLKYLTTQIKTNFAYKGSQILFMIGQSLNYIADLFAIYFLFHKFDTLGEYTFNQVLLTYAIIVFVFSFDEMMFRGFDEFDKLIGKGDLDRLLLRPRNMVLQICGYKIETGKLLRAVVGLVLIVVAYNLLGLEVNFMNIFIVIEMVLSGIITFFGVYLFTSSITIFTIKKAEFINIFTDGGRNLCYYPLDIFKKWITKFFTFIIPYASFNYLPLRYLLGFSDASVFNIIYPAFSIVFAILGYICFNVCLKHYKSAG